MYVLHLKRDAINVPFKVVACYKQDKFGTYEYEGTEIKQFNYRSSIDTTLLDIDDTFYSTIYSTLSDLWYIPSNNFKPIEFWIHEYVRYGVSFKVSFSAYYSTIISVYQKVLIDLPVLELRVEYNEKWQKIN